MDYKYNEIIKMINNGGKPLLMYHISKEEVLTKNMKEINDFMKLVTRLGVHARQSCAILCSGYDDVPDELFEIQEVRDYVDKLFKRHPYILYYVNTELETEHWLLSSMANEINSMYQGSFEEKNMNAYELFDRFGTNTPRFHSLLTFERGDLAKILKPILDHGKKIGDKEHSERIAVEYAKRFNHWESTLKEMGLNYE